MTPTASFASDVSPIVLDIETAPILNAREFIEAPDLSDVSAPSNYKDPEKIAAYIEDAKAKKLADFERDVTSKAALDFNLARIVAIGHWTEAHHATALLCRDEQEEANALDLVWELCRHRMVVGFRIREFDVPLMVQRSRYLRVNHPLPDLGRYAKGNGITDLFDVLTFNGLRAETIMRQTCKSFARRFGIAVSDLIDGGQIPALVAAGEWDQVRSHVLADIVTETALAQRLGIIRADVPVTLAA